MSYCVNCGVELAASEPRCPLCATPVQNPRVPGGARGEGWDRPYPAYLETVVRGVDRRYFSSLAAVLCMIPVLLCLIIDLLTGGEGLSWSGYVVGAIGVLMVTVLLPIGWGRRGLGVYLGLDVAAMLALLFYIDLSTADGLTWFLPLAAPITLAAGAIVWMQLHHFLRRREKGVLIFLALMLFGSGALVVLIEIFLRVYRGLSPWPHWSWYTLVPCTLMGVGALILNRRRQWKESIKKRLFF